MECQTWKLKWNTEKRHSKCRSNITGQYCIMDTAHKANKLLKRKGDFKNAWMKTM